MSNIYAEPFIPDEDYDNPAMITDFYEFTMANCLFLNGFKDTVMVFDMFFRKNPGRTEITAILIVLAGIVCFFFEGLSTGKLAGDVLALLSGVLFAGVFMLNEFEKGDALSSMFLGQLMCGVFLSPFVLRETDFSAPVLAAVFVLGAVQVGLAYILFSIGTAYTDPVTAAVINAIEPILNPILVAVFYGETLGKLSLAGAAVVICGVLFYNLAMSRRKE